MMQGGTLTLGLVLTMDRDEAARRELVQQLRQRSDVLLAPAQDHRLPLVIETRAGEDRAAIEGLQALPGVEFCDVVYAHFDECEDAP